MLDFVSTRFVNWRAALCYTRVFSCPLEQSLNRLRHGLRQIGCVAHDYLEGWNAY